MHEVYCSEQLEISAPLNKMRRAAELLHVFWAAPQNFSQRRVPGDGANAVSTVVLFGRQEISSVAWVPALMVGLVPQVPASPRDPRSGLF